MQQTFVSAVAKASLLCCGVIIIFEKKTIILNSGVITSNMVLYKYIPHYTSSLPNLIGVTTNRKLSAHKNPIKVLVLE